MKADRRHNGSTAWRPHGRGCQFLADEVENPYGAA